MLLLKRYNRISCISLYLYIFHLSLGFVCLGACMQAKCAASMQNKWLLVNIQSTKEFNSLMLNRDTWTNDAVSQIITTNFIFLQVYDDTTKGKKLCTYYKLNSIPVVLIIHPITGQNMHSWEGLVQPQTLLEVCINQTFTIHT